MLKSLKYILFSKHQFLLVAAVVLFVASFTTQQINNKKYLLENVQSKFQQLIQSRENDFKSLLTNGELLKEFNNSQNNNPLSSLINKPYGVFLYSLDSASCALFKGWSNNKYYLHENDINPHDTSYIANYENGFFEIVKATVNVDSRRFLLIGVIPIKWNYFIKNKYLTSQFDELPYYEKYYEISDHETATPITTIGNKTLFYLKQTQAVYTVDYDWLTITFRLLGILCILLLIHQICVRLIEKNDFNKTFIVVTIVIVGFRAILYRFHNFPFNKNKLTLFDPSIYASNFLHPSLGDLLINLCLIFWLLTFYKNNKPIVNSKINSVKYIFNLFVFCLIINAFISIIKSLVIDSKISFDVSNFFSLNSYSAIAFIAICLLCINFYQFALLLLQPLLKLDSKVSNFLATENKISLPLIWILFFSATVSALIVSYNKKLELAQREKIAEKIYLQNDATTENLLNIATTGFSDVFFQINFARFKNQATADFIKDSLIAENFSGYLNNYETKIYLFNKDCKSIYNGDTSTTDSWNKYITTSGKSIGLDGLFSISTSSIGNSYIYKRMVLDKDEQLLCQLFVLLHPKKNKSKGVLPELFKQNQDADLQFSYSYALYDSGRLVEQHGNYNFPITKDNIDITYFVSNDREASVLQYQPTKHQSIVVVKTSRFLLDFVTLFAYLFFTFLIVVMVLFAANAIIQHNYNYTALSRLFKFNIRNQIRTTIIFTSLVSFIIIGVITVFFFINKFNQSSQDKLIKSINFSTLEIENNIIKNDTLDSKQIENILLKISEQQALDFNLFDASGSIIGTTQPYIYNRKLVDNKMNPIAYQQIYAHKQNLFKQEEKIGQLPFLSLYKSIVNDKGKIVACVNIPYLNAEAELNQEISGFIATLMNLNAFIFLIAGAIAYFITNRITRSFRLIKEKMKSVNWQIHNDEISWNRDDEIGALVNEYNMMVRKLDETAKAFALSQRELAWKEMAKQVAHEIKNPLTPMKLSIQYLKKNIDDDSPNVKEVSQRVASTLIEQIDQLATIAGDFSQFANIGNDKPESIDLNDVITNVVNLYNADNSGNIVFEPIINNAVVFADKNQLMRLFTNLIKNAIEASVEKEKVNITINQTIKNNAIITSIKDQGCGISKELQSKIFTFNFTTKTSGTGLGLAICKGIVENADGKIWFQTNEMGSIFFVELPLVFK